MEHLLQDLQLTLTIRKTKTCLPCFPFLLHSLSLSLKGGKKIIPFFTEKKKSHCSTCFRRLSLFLNYKGEILSPATTFTTWQTPWLSLISSSTIITAWCNSYTLSGSYQHSLLFSSLLPVYFVHNPNTALSTVEYNLLSPMLSPPP